MPRSRRVAILAVGALAGSMLTVGAAAAGSATGPTSAARCAGHVPGDLNGDGYADVVTGDPQRTVAGQPSAGSIQIDYGSASGIDAGRSRYIDQSTPGVPGDPAAVGDFGGALAVADFNGDCYDDLAIGASGFDSATGSVTVLYGSRTGITTSGAARFTAPASDHGFGFAVAAGDVNKDGYADLAVGAPTGTDDGVREAGQVGILYGGHGGLAAPSQWIGQDSPGVPGVSEQYDRMGWAVAAGDFNGDGYADVAMGTPQENDHGVDQAGAVRIVYGSAGGLVTVGATSVSQNSRGVPGVNEDGDQFGRVLTGGDVNQDGYDDLIVGVMDEAIGSVDEAGDVAWIPGGPAGITGAGTKRFSHASAGIPGTPWQFGFLGFALSVGDLNGDNYPDMVAGSPQDFNDGGTGSGSLLILYGTAGGPAAAGATLLSEATPGVPGQPAVGAFFGAAVLVAPVHGATALNDLIVGAPQQNVGGVSEAGAVYLIPGVAGTGPTGSGAVTVAQAPNAPAPRDSDDFGEVLR